MSGSRVALAAALTLVVAAAANAAPLPSGTIACQVASTNVDGLRFQPYISSDPSPTRIRVTTTMQGTCDNSGVMGGKAPITELKATLAGKLAVGSTCSTLTTMPQFERLKLKIKWRGVDGNGRLKTVASTTVHFVDANWDDDVEGLVLQSQPLKGAFEGSTSTVTLALQNGNAFFNAMCPRIEGDPFGQDGESTITIP
jgi:hypothetical protein